ncbi:ABC transporter permease [Mycobacteroides saopaulense]|uniref:DUF3533 domain-containing protein n=1 Tax=Mycobacteroides saopaulense TaxID=1578165 RepID=UPI0012FFC436|nr:DUF3533 domain-containing protein [Mycobacteroides saopaulense]
MSRVKASRIQLFLINWVAVILLAVVLPAGYLLVLTTIGVDLPHLLALYGFSVLTIAAVGMTAISILTVVGAWGMRINLIFFIALGLPSSGGVIALQAAPPIYRYLSTFEPMHQIYLGTRSLLYFDANMGAGLRQALLLITACLVAGLVVGLAGNHLYDRRGLVREPVAAHQ